MNFKRPISFLLAILILSSNMGLAFNVHYCHNEIAAVSLQYKVSEPCEETPASCCAKTDNHKKCCSDKLIKIEKKTDEILVKSFQLDLQTFIFSVNACFFTFPTVLYTKTKKIIAFCNVPNAPPLYKLYCRLIFYA